MRRSKFTDSQILAVPTQTEAGIAALDLCRERWTSAAAFYHWCSKFGGMDLSLMTRMKASGEHNLRIKTHDIEAKIKANIVAEALGRKTRDHRGDAW